jgi:hypothetical protein
MEPGVQAIGVAQSRQVAPGLDQRILDCVLGTIGVAEYQPSQCIHSGDDVLDQDAERFPISLLGSAHELVVHRLDPFRRRNSSLR